MTAYFVAISWISFGAFLLFCAYVLYHMAHDKKQTTVPTETPSEIRGIADDNLKFIPTTNLIMVALARTMEAQGVEDEPLIQELYKRGRSSTPK